MDDSTTALSGRLQIEQYSRSDCNAAIEGKKIPDALGLRLHRLCTIRGMRYNPGFGHELKGILPEFTRAIHARMIMSDMIPDIATPEDEPYCIWHPQTASEDTYRELLRKYPSMLYKIARACAVAGYTGLYNELAILPEVHIAEEAREAGSTAIFDSIMAQPVRYSVFDDYDRSLNTSDPRPAHLNGDTAVHWLLDIKQGFSDIRTDWENSDDWSIFDWTQGDGVEAQMFDITEDMNVDIQQSSDHERHMRTSRAALVELLTEPLPQDLPLMDKNILICMAAYYGDIDRYCRLRRPCTVPGEVQCCMRGAYHNTMFAVWWSKQPTLKLPVWARLRKAVEARFIMNNVLSRITDPSFKQATPYLIWYPALAQQPTYRKLAELRPDMLPQILRSCIVAGYRELFDVILPKVVPDEAILGEASASANTHYKEALEKRIQQVGLATLGGHEQWKKWATIRSLERSHADAGKDSYPLFAGGGFDGLYNGHQCDGSEAELAACLPDHWKLTEDDDEYWRGLDYINWPPWPVTSASVNNK